MNERSFLRQVAQALRCDEQRAESIVFIVFQELRERITPREAADVAAQLPAGLKRLWLENETATALFIGRTGDFLGRVRQHGALPDEAEAARGTRAVFSGLAASARQFDGHGRARPGTSSVSSLKT
jgi:uncharacterized protein (DUF2267 family)